MPRIRTIKPELGNSFSDREFALNFSQPSCSGGGTMKSADRDKRYRFGHENHLTGLGRWQLRLSQDIENSSYGFFTSQLPSQAIGGFAVVEGPSKTSLDFLQKGSVNGVEFDAHPWVEGFRLSTTSHKVEATFAPEESTELSLPLIHVVHPTGKEA